MSQLEMQDVVLFLCSPGIAVDSTNVDGSGAALHDVDIYLTHCVSFEDPSGFSRYIPWQDDEQSTYSTLPSFRLALGSGCPARCLSRSFLRAWSEEYPSIDPSEAHRLVPDLVEDTEATGICCDWSFSSYSYSTSRSRSYDLFPKYFQIFFHASARASGKVHRNQ